jgi:hypothetical protein
VAEADPIARTAAIDAYRHRLEHLRATGQQLRIALASSSDSPAETLALAVWQRECAATVSQLSGGSKRHWLSRAFSDALLVSVTGADSASVVSIIDRLLDVLDSAGRSVAGAVEPQAIEPADPPSALGRFEYVKNAALRSSLERAYLDGQEAFTRGESTLALLTFCSILEAVITGALERHGVGEGISPEPVVSWPFAARIAMAERAGLISRACARLPATAREYRDHLDLTGEPVAARVIPLRDARLTRDVLHVVLRDLSPGR